MAGEAAIVVKDLDMGYGDFVLMRNLNFTVNRGDVFIIMGGSGCGKSTLLKILVGLKNPSRGAGLLRGHGLLGIRPGDPGTDSEAVRDPLSERGLWSSMTLAENIALPLEQYTELKPSQIREVVSLKLALVGLAGFEDFYPSEISGGMKKRAGLARAMAMDPDILFFDEPSAGLDPVSSRLLDDLILELRESLRTTIVVVTHELASIFAIGNNSVYLDVDERTMSGERGPQEASGGFSESKGSQVSDKRRRVRRVE